MISWGFPISASAWDKRAGLWYFRALNVLERGISLEEELAVFPAGFCRAAGGHFLVGGGFASARVETNLVRGPYHCAYLDHSGDYFKLPDRPTGSAAGAYGLAAGKAYAALLKYLAEHNMKIKLPTLEIYQNSTLTVEMDI